MIFCERLFGKAGRLYFKKRKIHLNFFSLFYHFKTPFHFKDGKNGNPSKLESTCSNSNIRVTFTSETSFPPTVYICITFTPEK